MIFRYSQKQLPVADVAYLRGYLAFVKSIEPQVVSRLELKYGPELLMQIMDKKL